MMKNVTMMALIVTLSGCGGGMQFGMGGGGLFGGAERSQPSAAMRPDDTTPRPELRPGGEQIDGEPAPGGGTVLGFAVASLGDASVPGLWMETPLVSSEGPGRVVGPDGRTVAVTLRPAGAGDGGGSRLSLQAMQALGLDLASLPTVTVLSDA